MSDPDEPDEPRVKDMDPATIAQLASWFDLPSFAQVEEGAAPVPPPEQSDAAKIQEHRRKVLAQIEPALVERMEQHRTDAQRLEVAPPPVRPWHERRTSLFDDSTLPPPFDPYDAPEVEVPAALVRDLGICTPQAFLRDLYRPEKEFWVQLRSPWEDEEDSEPAPADPMAPVREALAQRYQATPVPPATVSIAASAADLRGLLARPWQEAKRERARAREAELLGKLEGAGAVSRGPEEAP